MRNKIKIRNILTAVLIYTCFSPVVSSINRVDLPQSVLDENGGMYMSDNNSNSDSLSKATGLATHELSSSTEQWLNNFGTARIQLNIDDHGKWDHSSFDFLYPLFDNDKEILFAQMGFRAPDDRQTINLGMGVRTFTKNNWLIGGNIFFDNDTKGDNRRVGVGAEAWTDNFKLSANTYLGTTDWHSSRDFNNYNEKVANGFDVRAEGNLPLNPKIGIKLIYEKYQGDNVALFSKSELEKNPYSFTTGINYTPIPLITTGVDYRVGGAGQDDMRFYVNFIYSLGQTWEALTSSSEVLNLRKISGSRYDLVERNNEIILDYKEKERNNIVDNISLTLMKNNSPADGKSRNVILLHAASLDGRPVKNTTVSWLVSGNAKLDVVSSITDNNGNATIYVTNTKAEEITVTAMAGKTLEKIQTTFVTSASNLKLSVLKNNSIANGKETNEAKVIVYDIDGNMLPDITISWSLSNDASIVSSSKVTDNNGQALIKFSNTKPGQVTLTATAGDIESQATTAFIAVPVTKVAVTMTTNNSPADGTTQNVAQAVVTGADGKPLKGVNVTWSIGGSATGTSPLNVTTNASGIAVLSLTSIQAQNVTVSAAAGGKSGQTTAAFTAISVSTVAVTMTTNNSPADGTTQNVAQAVVTGADGKPLKGVNVTWSIGGSATGTSPLNVTTNASGIAVLSLTSIQAQNVTVSAAAGGKSGQTTAAFTAISVSTVAVTMTTNNSPADGTTQNVAQAVVNGADGKPLKGVNVTWSIGGSATGTSPLNVTTNASGIAVLSLTSIQAQNVTVSAAAGGKSGQTTAAFTAISVSTVAVTMTTNNSPADGTTQNVAQAVVTSADGKPLKGVNVTWSIGGSATGTSPLNVTTNASGIAVLSLTSIQAQNVTVSAAAGGKSGQTTAAFTAISVSTVAVTMTTNNSPADGTTQNVAQAVVNGADGKPLKGVNVTWSIGGSATGTSPLNVTTNASGIAVLSLTSIQAQNVTVSAAAGGKSGQTTAAFTAISVSTVAVTMTTNNSPADGTTQNVAQAVVTSADGKPLKGVNVTWSIGGSATGTSPLNVTTNASGIAVLSLTSIQAQNVTVSAAAGGKSGQTTAAFIEVPAEKATDITFDSTGQGNRSDPGVITATVVGKSGTGIAGISVTWNYPANSFLICAAPSSVTNSKGQVSISCYATSGNVADQPFNVRVDANASQDPTNPVTRTFTRDFRI